MNLAHDEKDAKGERELFEAHLDQMMQDDEPAFNRLDDGRYESSEVQMHWQTWQAARADTARIVAEAVAEALKCTDAMAVALEQEMDNQLRASGMDANHVHRQDGFELWAAAIRARSAQPDAGEPTC